jgi:acyl-coenzyme A synthetase/AMP-(fatty) acid ligase
VCTWYEVPRDRPLPDPLPIGSPLPVVEAIVEGDGELLIRGPTVMHGYWGDRQRTGQVLEVRDGQRTYRTGDLVRRGRDGELVFLGRRDAQVKTRGFRVELEEIEAALLALEGVVEAAVIAVPDEAITNRLKAYVVTDGALDARELGRLCRERLPAYMIPEQFELRQELPKSSTGKVDRRALQGQQDRG